MACHGRGMAWHVRVWYGMVLMCNGMTSHDRGMVWHNMA